jgi:hypothetical protein
MMQCQLDRIKKPLSQPSSFTDTELYERAEGNYERNFRKVVIVAAHT